MTIYNVSKAYGKNDKIYYQVLPYSLRGTIIVHFKFMKGFKSLIPFLMDSHLSEKKANKVASELKCE